MRKFGTPLGRSCAILAVVAGATLLWGGTAAIADPLPDKQSDVSNGSAHAAHDPSSPAARAALAAALPSGYPINGIDVSSHDHANGHTVNWADQRAAGDEFAYVKATEGTGYVNPYFDQDYHGAKDNGLNVGAYAFGRPDLGNPVGQANNFVDHLQWATDGKTLPPFLDLEWPYPSLSLPTCYGLSQGAMRSWISSFLNQLQSRIGRTPMIYTNVNWWNPCTGNSTAFSGYLLDVASCDASPPSVPGWGTRWTIWQYDIEACGRGAVHDSNVFNGSPADLAVLAGAPSGGGGPNGVVAGDVTGDARADLIARKPDGTLWLYTNGGSNTTPYGTVTQIGTGWQQFRNITLADVTGDGRADMVAARADGTLWLYANGGSNTTPYDTGVQIGTAWQQFTWILAGDVTADGRADIVAERPDGTLWLFINGGSNSAPYSTGIQIGVSWQQFNRIQLGDVTGDHRADIVASRPDGTLWLYTNGGSNSTPYGTGTQIGTGWQILA